MVPDDRPTAEEFERLYSSLGAEERDDLLQEILVAWANGEAAMAVVVDVWLLDHARQLGNHRVRRPGLEAVRDLLRRRAVPDELAGQA